MRGKPGGEESPPGQVFFEETVENLGEDGVVHSWASNKGGQSPCRWKSLGQALGEKPSVGMKGKSMYNMATVHLAGRLTREPELKFRNTANGRTLVLLNLALNHRYQDGKGKWAESEPTFVEVQCWGKLANNVLDCMGKGMSVLVIGRLIQSSWEVEQDGEKVKRSVLRVKASHVGPDLNWQRARALKDEDFGDFEPRGSGEAAVANSVRGASGENVNDNVGDDFTGQDQGNKERELVGAGIGRSGGMNSAGRGGEGKDKPPF